MAKDPLDYSSMNLGKMLDGLGDVNDVAGKQLESTLSLMFDGMKKGIMPKQVLNLGEDKIESLYTQAYTMYNQGKYKEASYLFFILMSIDPTVAKHVMGCAACFHRQQMYQKAAELYILCSSLDPENPLPDFHAADCHIKLQLPPLAAMHLKNVIERARDNPDHAVVKERAIIMLDAIEKEIEEAKKNPKNIEETEEEE